MSKFCPVATLEEFNLLDEGEILEGYFDGFHDAPEPSLERSRSYRHGWLNGQVDNGNRDPDEAQEALNLEFERLLHLH
jgi:hypothetical protein